MEGMDTFILEICWESGGKEFVLELQCCVVEGVHGQ